jgi:PmbA protein
MTRNPPAEIARRILDHAAARVDAAEVLYQDSESRAVNFQDNVLRSVSGGESSGVGLRVIHRGRLGFASTNDFEAVGELIDNAVASAAFGQEARFSFPGAPARVTPVLIHDPRVPALEMPQAAERVRAAIDLIRAEVPEAQCGGGIETVEGRMVLCNTAGLHWEETSTHYSMDVGAFLVRGESFLGVDEGEDSARYSEGLAAHARKVVEWLRLARRERRVKEETLPVLFTPRALEVLLGAIEVNVNGKTAQKGASMLSGRLGERIVDARVGLYDDPLVDYAGGSMSVDAEGVPARRTAIIEAGVLKELLYDLQTAGLAGVSGAGHASRGYASPPAPGPSNLRMAAGERPWRELLRGMKRGLLVDSALGAGQSNILAGEFAVNVELGFLVERGEIVGRVKDCMVAGNVFDALNRLRGISSETEWHGELEAPYVCVEGLSVVGSGG